MKHLFILTLCFFTTLLSAEETTVHLCGEALCYQGNITKAANEKLFTLFDKNKPNINTLIIKSQGGEINVGMDLGDFVFANQLTIKVNDYCLSSCANYVFPAGKNKILAKNALIGFHGGTTGLEQEAMKLADKMPPDQKEKILSYMYNTQQREINFFEKITVKRAITTLGQDPKYTPIYEKDDNIIGWYYSIADLNKLGVKNITVINPPWEYKALSPKAKAIQVMVSG